MNKRDLAKKIFDVSHITGDYLLRSGLRSKEYFDKYRFEANPHLLRSIAEHLAPLVPADIDYLAGLEMGGIPIATALSLEMNKPVLFIRKTAKEYGTCQFAEGASVQGKKLCLIEDVVTTGGQVVLSTQDLRKAGAIVSDVICVINRNNGPSPSITENGLNLISLFTMDELKDAGRQDS